MKGWNVHREARCHCIAWSRLPSSAPCIVRSVIGRSSDTPDADCTRFVPCEGLDLGSTLFVDQFGTLELIVPTAPMKLRCKLCHTWLSCFSLNGWWCGPTYLRLQIAASPRSHPSPPCCQETSSIFLRSNTVATRGDHAGGHTVTLYLPVKGAAARAVR